MQYTLVGTEEGTSVLTVFVAGQPPQVAQSDHPNFEAILKGVMENDDNVIDLFDVAQTAASKFERLSERVTAANGRLYLDGEEVDNSLAQQVVAFLKAGVENWKPLVNFFENVQSNPNEHSREQLYSWLKDRPFTITPEGNLVGYKGVRTSGGKFESINHGKAIVDGQVFEGAIPNHKGAVIEMPRGEVEFNPAVGCHTGLHVGTYDYAERFAKGALLEVHVNPRDVVSVPTDCDAQKMRVCRYTVVDTIDAPHTSPITDDPFAKDFPEDLWWGDGEEDDLDEDELLAAAEELGVDLRPEFTPAPEATLVPEDTKQDALQVGDKFEDLDKRRNRVLEIVEVKDATSVEEASAVYKLVGGDQKGTVSLRRLLTPYRFRKV